MVPKPGANQTCANLVAQLAYDREWNTMFVILYLEFFEFIKIEKPTSSLNYEVR